MQKQKEEEEGEKTRSMTTKDVAHKFYFQWYFAQNPIEYISSYLNVHRRANMYSSTQRQKDTNTLKTLLDGKHCLSTE